VTPATRRAVPPVQGVYAIADAGVLGAGAVPAAVATMAEAGIGWIQIRAKRVPDLDLYRLVEEAVRRLEGSDAALWIDDRADVAALFPVAGVHVGQDDLPPSAVRRVVGEGTWIGRSTHGEAQLREADADPEVDVVALGPIFATTGKERPDPVVGVEELRRLRAMTEKPLVAIGGIDAGTLPEVLAAGADAAAVIGAVCRGDVKRNCERLTAVAKEVR